MRWKPLIILATVVVASTGAYALYGIVDESPADRHALGTGARLDATDRTASGHTLSEGDLAYVDYTVFIDGLPWRTTKAWVGLLLAEKGGEEMLAKYNASAYGPVDVVVGESYEDNPLLTVVSKALANRVRGEHLEIRARAPFGEASEVETTTLQRVWGPYDTRTEWTRHTYEERFGATAKVGETVSTNRLFNSTVVEVTDGLVVTQSTLQEGQVIALPSIHAFLQVEGAGENRIAFRLNPLRNVSFNLAEGSAPFGLRGGQYVVESIDETQITYRYHPRWSPFLVGLDFDIEVDVLPAGYVPPPSPAPAVLSDAIHHDEATATQDGASRAAAATSGARP